HEDRAELQAALQARGCGLDRVDVAVRHKQVVAPRVRGDYDSSRRNGPRDHIARRSVLLRTPADLPVLVLLVGIKTCAVRREAGQDRYLAARRTVIGLEPVPGQELGGAHEARYRIAVRIGRSNAAIDNRAQWKMGKVAGYGAVIVILGDEDVGG